jgi:three-Cys-motif partner protein
MTQPPDTELDQEQYAESPTDKLPARLVGDWSEDKHYYLSHYINIFEMGMHKKWASRVYIDLFAGPGVCMLRDEKRLTDGSPLIALKAAHPFTQYFFSDLDSTAISALKKRCEPFKDKTKIAIFEKDCNVVAAEISAQIDSKALCLAFLDPTGLDLKFSAIKALTNGKNMDLIIHFPHGTTINRNIEKFYAKDKSKMDEFFDGTEWRAIYESNPSNQTAQLLDLYGKKLAKIGYKMEPDQAVLVKNPKQNLPLYALLFASKSPKGNEFWKKIKQIESKGQRGLPGL